MTVSTRERLGELCRNTDDGFLRLFDLVERHFGSEDQDSIFREFSLKVGEDLHESARYVLTRIEHVGAPDSSDFESLFNKVCTVFDEMRAPRLVHEWTADNFARNPRIIFAHSVLQSADLIKFYMVTPNEQRYFTPYRYVLGKKSRHCPALMGVEWRPGRQDIEYREYHLVRVGSTEDLGRFLRDRWIEDHGPREAFVEELLRLVDDHWCSESPLIQYKEDAPTQFQISFKCNCARDPASHERGHQHRNLSDIADRFIKIGELCRYDVHRLEDWFRAAGDHRLTWLGFSRAYPLAFNLYGEV